MPGYNEGATNSKSYAIISCLKLFRILSAFLNSSAKTFATQRVHWLPFVMYADSAKLGQISKFAKYLSGESSEYDMKLAALIKGGALKGEGLEHVRCLVSALVFKALRMKAGCKRLTTSSIPGLDETAVCEAGFDLVCCRGELRGLKT